MRGSQNVQKDEVVDFNTDERLSRGTRAFLRALNSPAPPLVRHAAAELKHRLQ